jgi:hypothetical protein
MEILKEQAINKLIDCSPEDKQMCEVFLQEI